MKKRILTIVAALFLLTACGANNKSAETTNNKAQTGETAQTTNTTVKIGLTGSDSKTWNYVKEQAAKEGIDIELVFFDSYPLPNAALDAGEIDLNSFQHYAYLNKEVEELGYKITAIGETSLAPMGLYSKQITSLDELKDGDKILIPDDVTNGGRALKLLEAQGLIKVDEAAGLQPSLNDITENPRNFEIIELAATNIPPSLQEAPLAAINSGVATDAGLIPSEDAIVLETADTGNNPYINVIVARTDEKDNPIYKRIVELYQTDEVKQIVIEDSKGSVIPVWK